MFGIDRLVLSKPKEVKTVATKFTQNIKNAVDLARSKNSIDSYENTVIPEEPVIRKKLEKPALFEAKTENKGKEALEINQSNIRNIQKNSLPKVTILKPVAKSFLNQVNKIEDVNPKDTKNKLAFSYSDSKGSFGKIDNNGSRIKIVLSQKMVKDYVEEEVQIYNLQGQIVKQNGLFIQVKGWGNLKELSIINALKKSISKFAISSNEAIIHSYIVSSINQIADGGWECKVKVTPGKI